MGNRFLKWASALSAVALVSGVLAISASASIGASAGPVETDAPDLLTTTIDGDDVLFCFDEGLDDDDLGAADLFEIRGYNDSMNDEASDIDVDDDDDNCARATFDDGDRALEDYTIGTAEEEAVENDNGDANTGQSAELEGSTVTADEGQTTAPNLTDFESEDGDTGRYIFDDDVDCDILTTGDNDDANFGFYETDGDRVNGTAIEDCDDNEVEVTFPVDPDDGERYFIDNDFGSDEGGGDICTEQSSEGDRDCSELEHVGEDTDEADLEDAERTSEDEIEYSFDDDLDEDSDDPNDFYAYEEDGTEYTADDCETTGTGESIVRCEFSDLEDAEDFEVVLAAVEEDAVFQDDDDADGNDSTIGSAPIGTSAAAPGLTDAPDLESCEFGIDEGADDDELVNFIFDEFVDDDDTTEDEFQLIDNEGDESGSDDIEDQTDNIVEARFDSSQVDDAVGCSVTDADFDDSLGNFNSWAAVGRDPDGGSPTTATTSTTTSTSTSTVTTTPTSTRTPRTVRVATNLTIRYDRNDNAFKGAAGSSRKRCQTGRNVTLHKRGAGVRGTDQTNRRGNWNINKRARRGRWFADVDKKVFTARNGDTIICRTDESVTIKLGSRR